MDLLLKNKIAIVTGGSLGIGKAIAKSLALEGADIVICARSLDTLEKAANEIKYLTKRTIVPIQCDTTKTESIQNLVNQTVERFGRIDILFNNAGSGDGGNFPDETNEGWERVLSVNLSSVFYMSKAVWPHLISAGGGKIVNNSSLAAQRGFSKNMYDISGRAPSASYYASKAGVDAFTRYSAGMGGQHNIRVNAVRPGQIITPLSTGGGEHHHFKKTFDLMQIIDGPGYSEDVANAVLFLVTDESRFITGEFINVDGGMPAKL